jgi:hypothetical protein
MIAVPDRISGSWLRPASRGFAATAAAILLAACAPVEDTATAAADPVAAPDDTATETALDSESTCPVIESRNWSAHVSGATLAVSGEIDLPTPGYTVTLKEGPADRAMPPAQHLLLELTPPDGMVTQVVTTVAVRYEGSAVYPEYRAIIVQCNNQVLAAITEVATDD